MSSRFTRLFKPARGQIPTKDSDVFSVAVSSVSSNSTDEKTISKKDSSPTHNSSSKHQSDNVIIPNQKNDMSSVAASSYSSNITTEIGSTDGFHELNATTMGSSALINDGFNDSVSTFASSSDPNESQVLKFSDAEARLLKWSWNEPLNKEHKSNNQSINGNLMNSEGNLKGNSISEAFSSSQFWSQIYNNVDLMDENLVKLLPAADHQTVFFTGIIRMAVLSSSDLSVMSDYLKSIGRRHGILFGAEPTYFETLGIAVIRALNDHFGEDFTPQLEHVWILLYCFISNTMIESCSIDPVLPEDVSIGITASFEKPDDRNTSLKKKKSVFSPGPPPNYLPHGRSRFT